MEYQGMIMIRILLVEDDCALNEILTYHLEKEGYYVVPVLTKAEAFKKLDSNVFEFILLDVTLSEGDSFDICKFVKEISPKTAICFLTARDLENDILKGYNMGADDYVTKPFSLPILLKKIAAIARRIEKATPKEIYSDCNLQINFTSLTAYMGNEPIEFTPLEFKLLELLVKNTEHIVTREKILDAIWDSRGNYVEESALNTMVSRIRRKIDSEEHRYIKTVYGTGYMWIAGDANEK